MIVGIYAGSFDPLTLGHMDLIKRSFAFCEKLIIGIGVNSSKKTFLDLETREELINETLTNELPSQNWEVKSFHDLLVNFAKESKANILIRGIRNVSDFEYEINLANINKVMMPSLETVFLPTSPELAVVSSSMVREIAKYQGDISKFVPNNVAKELYSRFPPDRL